MNARQVYTVTELAAKARQLLEHEFGLIWLEGELSNFSAPASGHWYFSVKDSQAQIRGALFRNKNQHLSFKPKDGDKVLIRARVSLYEARGDFQLIAEYMEPSGFGALQQQFEKLKQKLSAEGLFAEDLKKPLPVFVHRLGVITSATGAALHDVLTVLKKRAPFIEVIVYPSMVQGQGAATTIIQAIQCANQRQEVDALLVTRGGGSLEDLWAFNDENLARCIRASTLPIVSAVGHEVDFTIADFAADRRAPTPSAGAALLSTDQSQLRAELLHRSKQLSHLLSARLHHAKKDLLALRTRLRSPEQLLNTRAQRLDEWQMRLENAIKTTQKSKHQQLELLRQRVSAKNPAQTFASLRSQLNSHHKNLQTIMRESLKYRRVQTRHLATQLHGISPLATLNRGYSITREKESQKLADKITLSDGMTLQTTTQHLTIDSTITQVKVRK